MIPILTITKYLEKAFATKLLFYFQDHSCHGFKYPIDDRFLADNSLPLELHDLQSLDSNKAEYRFFCNIEEKITTKNQNEFHFHLSKKEKKPLFFVVPYTDPQTEEDSYIIAPKFEIKIEISDGKNQVSYINYSEDENIFEKTKEDLENIILSSVTFLSCRGASPGESKVTKNNNIPSLNKRDLIQAINNTKEHMNKGDCYLANITTTVFLSDKKEFISLNDFIFSLTKIKSRFGIYYNDGNKALASFSPERFIASKNGHIIAEPIKGTQKIQGNHPNISDAEKIWNHKKEIYENTLVTDLLRHDLHSVCQPGSVRVYLPFYARISGHLIQMQSSIAGKLKESETLSTCLIKMLPAGSVTGTPKKRVCEIIAAQEKSPRGYYTGVAGILETNGDFDSIVLIRSIYMGKMGVYTGVGAGITTLSNTEQEIEEFKIKLESFLSCWV